MLIGQTCATDGNATKNTHEPFFGNLVTHDLLVTHTQPIQQTCKCMTYSASMQVPQSCTVTKLHINP